MTAAFAAAAAVALVAIVAAIVATRRATARVAAEQARAYHLETQLCEAVEGREAAEHARAAAVEEARATENRASEARRQLDSFGVLWELERMRLEREWTEITGSSAPLPEPWDGNIGAAVAVDLEILREVSGVPTRIESATVPGPMQPLAAMGTTRLIAEVVRGLVRVAEDIAVSFDPDDAVTLTIATLGQPEPALEQLVSVAAALGGGLTFRTTADGLQARLRLPAPLSAPEPDGGI